MLNSDLLYDTFESGKKTLQLLRYSENCNFEIINDLKERFRVLKAQAKLWTALVGIFSHKDFYSKYKMDESKKEKLIKLERFNNETLLMQLPHLKNFFDYLARLKLSKMTNQDFGPKLLLEQVIFSTVWDLFITSLTPKNFLFILIKQRELFNNFFFND